jgi:hypothetical protein
LQTVKINIYCLKVKGIPIAGAFLAFNCVYVSRKSSPNQIFWGFFLFKDIIFDILANFRQFGQLVIDKKKAIVVG